jgi:hypothetical protein
MQIHPGTGPLHPVAIECSRAAPPPEGGFECNGLLTTITAKEPLFRCVIINKVNERPFLVRLACASN